MITDTIEAMVTDWLAAHGWDAPDQINNGYCNLFADAVTKKVNGAQACWDGSHSHCFVVYRGWFYDSETPNGVAHPRQLPYYQRFGNALFTEAFALAKSQHRRA